MFWRKVHHFPVLLNYQPEHLAAMAVYPALDKIIDEAFWLADVLSGEAESSNPRLSEPDARDACVRAAVDALMTALADKTIRQLERFRFEGLEACLARLRPPRADNESWYRVAWPLYTEASTLSRYLQGVLTHVFGRWGAHFFEYAREVHAEARAMHDHSVDTDIGVLCGILDKPPLVVEVEDFAGEPLTALQKQILTALDGRAMKKTELALKVCGSEDYGNILYRPGGLMELREKGLVDHKWGVGFFRPDRPPPDGIVRTS